MCDRLTVKVTKFQESSTNRFWTVAKHCLGGGGKFLPPPYKIRLRLYRRMKQCRRKFIGTGFCSHWGCYFRNNFCSRAGLLCSIFKRCNTCSGTESTRPCSQCTGSVFFFHYRVQCEHSLRLELHIIKILWNWLERRDRQSFQTVSWKEVETANGIIH